MEKPVNYGDMLREWRSKKKWSQRALAKELGCSDGYITLIESAAKVPSMDLCMLLIQVLQLRPQDEQAFLDAVEDARRQDADQRARMRRAAVRGVIRLEYLSTLPIRDFLADIPSAKRIRMVETFSDLVNQDEYYEHFTNAVTDALTKGATIQVLLIDPDSYGAKQRVKELQRAPTPIPNALELMALTLARFYKLQCKLGEYDKQHQLEIKLYDASPSIALHMWDDEAYFSFFPVNDLSHNDANMKISMLNSLGDFISKKFNELWDQRISIDLRSYMEIQIKINNDIKSFYYHISKNKGIKTLYLVCKDSDSFIELLDLKILSDSFVNFIMKDNVYRGKFRRVTLNDEKDQVIKDIIAKYEWNERDREHYIGKNPEIFFLKLSNQKRI